MVRGCADLVILNQTEVAETRTVSLEVKEGSGWKLLNKLCIEMWNEMRGIDSKCVNTSDTGRECEQQELE